MSKKGYAKVKGAEGIYKYHNSGNYLAMKKIDGKQYQETFTAIFEEKQWSNIDIKNRRMLIKHSCVFHPSNKTFLELKPFTKNKESRPVFITDEILEILKRREAFRILGNDFVFHVQGNPIHCCKVQMNYRDAQRKSGVPYSGTHILRHGMAKLARQIGGGLDAVIAMTICRGKR